MLTPEESFGIYSFNLKSIVNPTSSSECFQAKFRAAGQYQEYPSSSPAELNDVIS